MLGESPGEYRVRPGYSFGHDWLSTGRLAVAVIRQPQGLDVKEMHPKSSLENAADVALPTPFRADEDDEHALERGVRSHLF
jgi:hypothetical protein